MAMSQFGSDRHGGMDEVQLEAGTRKNNTGDHDQVIQCGRHGLPDRIPGGGDGQRQDQAGPVGVDAPELHDGDEGQGEPHPVRESAPRGSTRRASSARCWTAGTAATSRSRRTASTTSAKQLYLPGTPILITRFLSADGVGEVVDFMPIAGDEATDRHRLVRMIRVVRGSMRFRMRLPAAVQLRPRAAHELEVHPRRARLPQPRAHAHREPRPARPACSTRRTSGRTSTAVGVIATLHQGDIGGVVLETGSPEPPRVVSPPR